MTQRYQVTCQIKAAVKAMANGLSITARALSDYVVGAYEHLWGAYSDLCNSFADMELY